MGCTRPGFLSSDTTLNELDLNRSENGIENRGKSLDKSAEVDTHKCSGRWDILAWWKQSTLTEIEMKLKG